MKTILTTALLAASTFAGSAYADGFAFSPSLLHTYPASVAPVAEARPSLHGVVLGRSLVDQTVLCTMGPGFNPTRPCSMDGNASIGPFDTVDVLNLQPLDDGAGTDRVLVGVDITPPSAGVSQARYKPVRIVAARIQASDANARRAARALARRLGNPVSVTPTTVTWQLNGAVEELIHTGPDRLVALAYQTGVTPDEAHLFADQAAPDQAMDGL